MSEVKVNKISPRTNCGTVQLGDSGDTFTIPAGATITNSGTAAGFGATGAASWDTTVKTGDFTAVSGVGYFVNTTSGEIDVTLPAGSPGAVVAVKDYAKTWDTNNCVIISNSSEKIGGSTNNAILSTEGLAVTFIYIDSTQGWLITDDGLQSVADTNPYMVATGGTITTSGNDKIHTFTGPGTFTVCKVAASAANNEVSYVVVAGGGGGGCQGGGGGGAGGFRETKSPVTPYTASPLDGQPSAPNRVTVTATAFPITVGGGGSGTAPPAGATKQSPSGGVSTFSTITSAGGSGGGTGPQCGATLTAGGSGGGGRANQANAGAAGNTPATTPAQGTAGGQGGSSANAGGGGGGATDAGSNAGGRFGGCGGDGASSEITASAVVRGGGGGGGTDQGTPTPGTPGTGGQAGPGGGGAGGTGNSGTGPTSGAAGTDNTGGGGGGGSNAPGASPNTAAGANGGSGVVIIRYKFQ